MRVRPLLAVLVAVLLPPAAGCGPKEPGPVARWDEGDRTAIESQKALAATPGRDQALEQVRLASMALAIGDSDTAEAALRDAVGTMTDFQADGEFAAVVGAESRKEWKGEPYEKMAAFVTLGTLLWAEGERGNALAMYKSAVLADTGTIEERFRSDFVPAWVLQALVYQAEGEPDNAKQFMDRGVDAVWSRKVVGLLSDALARTDAPGDEEAVIAAKAVLSTALSAGTTAAPRDPAQAVRATISRATDLLVSQKDKPAKDRVGALAALSKRDFEAAALVLPGVAEAWSQRVGDLPSDATEAARRFEERMAGLLEKPPRVVLLVERGHGPQKQRDGRYGEVLRIVPGRPRAKVPDTAVDGAPVDPILLDTLTWQATTRGGRGVDGFLKGKAVFKDTSLITGRVLLEVAGAMASSRRRQDDATALVLALVGAGVFVAGAVTNPAADVRQWELLPDGWALVCGDWGPGRHALLLDGRQMTIEVPERDQLVGLVPAGPPGGSNEIRAR